MDWMRDNLWATWLAASVAMLALVRPTFVKRLHSGPELSLGHGKLVGTRCLVTEEITGLSAGRIKAGGETWTALPYDENLRIAAGERSGKKKPTLPAGLNFLAPSTDKVPSLIHLRGQVGTFPPQPVITEDN